MLSIIRQHTESSFTSKPSVLGVPQAVYNHTSLSKALKYTELWRVRIPSNMHANMKTLCKIAYWCFVVCKIRCIVNSGTLLSAKCSALGCFIPASVINRQPVTLLGFLWKTDSPSIYVNIAQMSLNIFTEGYH